MQVHYFPETDSIYIRNKSNRSTNNKALDEDRYVGYDENGDIMWVSLLNVSEGVDLDMFSGKDLEEASKLVAKHNIKVLAI